MRKFARFGSITTAIFVLRARERADPSRGEDGAAERQYRTADGLVSANDFLAARRGENVGPDQ
jgi:hypothetical protein